jgi:DNA-binding response OmpR family regulator
VLIVDDEEDIVTYLVTMLDDNGIGAVGAGNARTALEAIRSRAPELILLDIMLPGRSGLSLYREIRRSPATGKVPILFISGCRKLEELGDLGESESAEFADPSNYFEKPISVDALLSRIQELLPKSAEAVSHA